MTDLTTANAYMGTRLNTSAWDSASETDRVKSLAMAERVLSGYQHRVGPWRYASAVCEQALWLLQGDTRAELQQAGVTSTSIGNASETYSQRRDSTIAPVAWALLRGPSAKAGGLR